MSAKSSDIVSTAKVESFVYMPPPAAFGAALILVKPNLGYPLPAPVTVSLPVLGAVLRGLRRASPLGRIVITEGVADEQSAERIFKQLGVLELLDDNMRIADAESLLMAEYENIAPNPVRFPTMTAPKYIGDYDCCISVGTFKRSIHKDQPHVSASINNLFGVFPREKYHHQNVHLRGQLHRPSVPEVLRDVYFTVGRYFHGSVVDLTYKLVQDSTGDEAVPIGQVVWGNDLLVVDEMACKIAGEPTPDYIHTIRAIRDQLKEGAK
ncbi:MAG: DUF362 domain-containing protein [Anaerolineae bacterium]|jgi:hypothetical protein|nr:DUF362 domain-containing protein [Anaerolineae bacterium]